MTETKMCDDCGRTYETEANISICPTCYEAALEEEGL